MVFSGATFLARFLPAVLILYFIVPRGRISWRNGVLLAASLLFYFWGEQAGLLIMLASIAVNYGAALGYTALSHRKMPRLSRTVFIAGILANIALLGYYKYRGMFAAVVSGLTGGSFEAAQIVMPVGISFFTFQGMSYLIDCRRGDCEVAKNPLTVATYISLFPQLVAGPIVRYTDLCGELASRRESLEGAAYGIRRFVWGLGKKMLIANPLGEAAAEIFAAGGHGTPALAWSGAVAFTMQIFFDFAGYSDMAIGLGAIFGFKFPENFDYPYISRTVSEFWRRWHMTLSGWFRDYVYIPLGGNRCGAPRQILNLLLVWALTGLWHGAGWNFVLWGLYFALLLIIEKFPLARLCRRVSTGGKIIPALAGTLFTLAAVMFGWVVFNTPTPAAAWEYLRSMFVPAGGAAGNGALYYLLEYRFELLCGALLCTPAARLASRRLDGRGGFELLRALGAVLVLGLSLLAVMGSSFNPFIYFRF